MDALVIASSAAKGSSISITAGRNASARDLNALLHAAGQLPRIIVRVLLKTDKGECVTHPLLGFAAPEGPFYCECNVRRDGAPLQQRVGIILEHDDDVFRRTIEFLAMHQD